MLFYLRLAMTWLSLLLFVFVIPGCATSTFASDGERGDRAVITRVHGSELWCTRRIIWNAGEPPQPGPAWRERRACAGEATDSCYQRLGDHATSAELTDCMAPLVERCERAFHRVCGAGVEVAGR